MPLLYYTCKFEVVSANVLMARILSVINSSTCKASNFCASFRENVINYDIGANKLMHRFTSASDLLASGMPVEYYTCKFKPAFAKILIGRILALVNLCTCKPGIRLV